MTRHSSALLLLLTLAACGSSSDAPHAASTPAAPVATRGYLPESSGPTRRANAEVAPPAPAVPLDPAEVTPEQPENVKVQP